jgi:class 3 adenylate cyclase
VKACPSCGLSNADDARFCAACGAPQAARCPRCGAELPDGARFCPSCGAPVGDTIEGRHERKLITVLFADLADYTGLGERFDAEQLREIMELYFAAVRREIEGEGGTVEKYSGDAVMAVFGVPLAHEDDPTRALRAALRMRGALAELNMSLAADPGVTLEMYIGVNMGEIVVVSSPKPGEAMVVGDPVSVAARLQQVAEPGQIVVSERAARASKGMRFRELGPLQLKGKGQTVQAVELIEADLPLGPGVAGVRAPLIGREREVALLRTVFQRVMSEARPNLVTIYGEAGVGKSRLIEEFAAWTSNLDVPARTHSGRCLPYGEGVSFWALAEILKREASILDSDPTEVAVGRIGVLAADLLGPARLVEDVGRATEILSSTVGLGPGPAAPSAPESDLRRARQEVAEVWSALFSALARRDPTVVHVEDLHWADPAMLELLETLADRVEGPLLFVCSARPELTGRHPGWGGGRWNFSSILLEPLGAGESGRLLDYLLAREAPGEDPLSEVRRTILERGGGNPFFLEEIVRHLADEGRLGRDSAGPVQVPDTVQGVLAARMDLLGSAEKRTLQAAAVVGKEFWLGPVSRLEGVEPGRLDDTMDRLRERGLILSRLSSSIAGEREFMFKHVLTRDAAYESIPRRDRAVAHAEVAAWIEEQAAGREREFAELLAHHYGEAHAAAEQDIRRDPVETERLRQLAFDCALVASEESRRKLALDNAARLAQDALGVASGPHERARALEALGETFVNEYRGDEAWATLKEAVELRMEGGGDLELPRLVARALEVPTRMPGFMRYRPLDEEARPLLAAGLAAVGDRDTEELARLLVVQSFWPYTFRDQRYDEEQLRTAREAGERAAQLALRLGRETLASAALDAVATFYVSKGHYGRVRPVIERRLELAGRLDDPWEAGEAHASAAWMALMAGRYADAAEIAGRGFDLVRLGPTAIALYCLDWRAVARFHLGDWDGLFADTALFDSLLTRREEPPAHAMQHVAVGAFVHEVRGDPDQADAALRVLFSAEETDRGLGSFWEPWLARLFVRRGRFEEAERRLALAEGDGTDRAELGLVLQVRCDLVAERGSWEKAAAVVDGVRAHAEEARVPVLALHADRLEGRAGAAAGEGASARELLERAADGFREIGARWEAARTDLLAARESEDPTDRRRRAKAAMGVFASLGAVEELALAEQLDE